MTHRILTLRIRRQLYPSELREAGHGLWLSRSSHDLPRHLVLLCLVLLKT